ncbi:MAG: SDR family oxidoreductase [Pseudonocardia sp.]|nr:SDR family oxidoreductase [Pseudonocardia sp.]
MSTSFEPTSAVVTGASRGIGRAVAVELAHTGATVALLARSGDGLEESARRVRAAGGRALVVRADLGDLEQVEAAAERIRDRLGDLDVLVNNAAVVSPLGPSTGTDPAEWARAITINLTAVATFTFALLPGMLERRRGRIVNVSSGVAADATSMIRGNAYVTSKTALEAHTLNLAAELAGTGVTVNVFRPGTVDTAMQEWIRTRDPRRIGTDLHARFTRFQAEGSLITPEQSARSLVALLRTAATGRIWTVSDHTLEEE